MIQRSIIQRIIIIGFMVLAGFCLAKNFYQQSIIGVILAIVGLVAGIYFIILLNQAKQTE